MEKIGPGAIQDSADHSGVRTNLSGGLGPRIAPSGLDCLPDGDQSLSFIFTRPTPTGTRLPGCEEVDMSECNIDKETRFVVSPESQSENSHLQSAGQSADQLVDNLGQEAQWVSQANCEMSGVAGALENMVESGTGLDFGVAEILMSEEFSCSTVGNNLASSSFSSVADTVYVKPCGDGSCPVYHELAGVPIQLNPCAFFEECFSHPSGIDPRAGFIFEGVRDGFRIVDDSFCGSYFCENYQSILDEEFKDQMDHTIRQELRTGKVSLVDARPQCVHSLGAIRKGNGKLRPITDCRRPEGCSINNFMDTTCETFTFTKLDDVAEYMKEGDWFAVLDLKSAYRSVHIAPEHRTCQGFCWKIDGEDRYLVDNCLCFGLKCAPYIFSQLTDFIVRSMERRGFLGTFGYLDDFLIVGNSREDCDQKLSSLIRLLRYLGFDIAWEKLISPSQIVTYLGIEVDSVEMEFRLPEKKLIKTRSLVSEFKGKTHATKKELQVLAGHLSHASTVVKGGRTFSRRLLNLIKYLPDQGKIVRLPDWIELDLSWWDSMLLVFNGSARIIVSNPDVVGVVSTDSSMTGFGGLWNNDWFVGVWKPENVDPHVIPEHHWVRPPDSYDEDMNINVLELWPVLESAARWGNQWSGFKVRILTDNTQVLQMINCGRSSSVKCMFWIRELFWLSFIHNFHLVASHISTDCNIIPDFLSRYFDPRNKCIPPTTLTECLCCFQGWHPSMLH